MPETGLTDFLHPYPLIQLSVAIATTIVAMVIGWRAVLVKKGGDEVPPFSQFYLTGPIEKALNSLDGIYRVLQEMRSENRDYARGVMQRHDKQIEVMQTYILNQMQMLDAVRGVLRATQDHVNALQQQLHQRRGDR